MKTILYGTLFFIMIFLNVANITADSISTKFYKSYDFQNNKLSEEISDDDIELNYVFSYYKAFFNDNYQPTRIEYKEGNQPVCLYWTFSYNTQSSNDNKAKKHSSNTYFNGEQNNTIMYLDDKSVSCKVARYENGELASIRYYDKNNLQINSTSYLLDNPIDNTTITYSNKGKRQKEEYTAKDRNKLKAVEEKTILNYNRSGNLDNVSSYRSLDGKKVDEKSLKFSYSQDGSIKKVYSGKELIEIWYYKKSGKIDKVDFYKNKIINKRHTYSDEGEVKEIDNFNSDGRKILIEVDIDE